MKGLQISSGVILLMTAGFLTQQIAMVSSAAMNMDNTCAVMSEGFIASPASCQEYGYCKGGKLIGTGKCPVGYLYNPLHGVCDFPANVVCSVNDVNTACQFADDQSFVADPTDCNRYCYCNKQKAECTTCPKLQVFDSRVTRCVYASSSPGYVCPTESVCRLVPNGVFLGTPDCGNTYVICINGMATTSTCPNGLWYNKQLGACQTDNPCIGTSPSGIGPGVLQPPQTLANACEDPSASAATPTSPVFVADKATCMGYYVCTSNNGVGIWTKCPPGLHFNAGKCVTPYTFECQFDRCGNMNETFVGAAKQQCKNYLICQNQTSQGPSSGYQSFNGLSCPNGMYFNEFSNECTTVNPASATYKLCT